VARRPSFDSPDHRSEARERTLSLLYEAEARQMSPVEVAAAQVVTPDDLTRLLVEGVTNLRSELDALITRHARGWALERMPSIDRCVLRMAIFELMRRPDVPTAVILDEAVELAKVYSTDDSGRFVNGVLSAVARQVRPVSPSTSTPES
jgi:N utilization substance protein B